MTRVIVRFTYCEGLFSELVKLKGRVIRAIFSLRRIRLKKTALGIALFLSLGSGGDNGGTTGLITLIPKLLGIEEAGPAILAILAARASSTIVLGGFFEVGFSALRALGALRERGGKGGLESFSRGFTNRTFLGLPF